MADNFDSQFEDEDFEDDFDENQEEDFEEDYEDDFEDEAEQDFEGDDFDDQGFDEEDERESGYDDSGDSGDDNDYDKPVDEGDIVEVEIEDLGSKGDGIARVDGFVVFVPGGEVGESYDVEVTSVGRKFAFAEITD